MSTRRDRRISKWLGQLVEERRILLGRPGWNQNWRHVLIASGQSAEEADALTASDPTYTPVSRPHERELQCQFPRDRTLSSKIHSRIRD